MKQSYAMKSAFNEEKRILELQKQEENLNSFFEGLKEHLSVLSQEIYYNDYYSNLFCNLMKEAEEKKFICYLLETDIILRGKIKECASEQGVEVVFEILSEKYLGGFILMDDKKNYQFNYTLSKALSDNQYSIGKMIDFTLKERRMTQWKEE